MREARRLRTEENRELVNAFFSDGGKAVEVIRGNSYGDTIILQSMTKSSVRVRAKAPTNKVVLLNDICTLEFDAEGEILIKDVGSAVFQDNVPRL